MTPLQRAQYNCCGAPATRPPPQQQRQRRQSAAGAERGAARAAAGAIYHLATNSTSYNLLQAQAQARRTQQQSMSTMATKASVVEDNVPVHWVTQGRRALRR